MIIDKISFLSATSEALGSILIAFTALSVHHKFLTERRVDDKVLKTMQFEQSLGVLGVILIVVGYLVEILA